MTPLPEPAYQRLSDLQSGIDSYYTEKQLLDYGKAEYERALLAAMNATLIYGKTGMVIAASMRFLREIP
jgi:hypothetical protein